MTICVGNWHLAASVLMPEHQIFNTKDQMSSIFTREPSISAYILRLAVLVIDMNERHKTTKRRVKISYVDSCLLGCDALSLSDCWNDSDVHVFRVSGLMRLK
jgi:hypothetical protein